MTKRTKYRMWAVYSPRGKLRHETIRTTRLRALAASGPATIRNWAEISQHGYRVARVIVSEIE